ncbi:MAG: DUF4175 family protein [Myxococcales bacterium]|nr:DUF4175 family protein [Myxococcales bacterium]
MTPRPVRTAPDGQLVALIRRLQRRLGVVAAVAVILWTAIAGTLLFLVAAWVLGPIAGTLSVRIARALVLTGALGGGIWAFLRHLPGKREAIQSLHRVHPSWVSRTRSALELRHSRAFAEIAPALVDAHHHAVVTDLTPVPMGRYVPLVESLGRRPLYFLGAAVFLVSLSALSMRARGGAYALLRPTPAANAPASALIVEDAKFTFTFPAYLEREKEEHGNLRSIEVPAGTIVDLRLRLRPGHGDSRLQIGDEKIRLHMEDGLSTGRFVAHADGIILIQGHYQGVWLEDRTRRTLRTVADHAPLVTMTEPQTDLHIDEHTVIQVGYAITDDVQVVSAMLVAEGMGGHRIEHPLSPLVGPRAQGLASFSTKETLALPGDVIRFWVEATDNDEVSGPKTGRSAVRRVFFQSAAQKRLEGLARLDDILGAGLAALATNLEHDGPGAPPTDAAEGFQKALETNGTQPQPGVDGPVLLRLAHSLEPLIERQKRGKDGARLTEELEGAVLLIADLVDSARRQDAAQIAQELDSLRQELAALLQELRSNPDPDLQRRAMAAIARARARLAELQGRLAKLGQRVPGDFVNRDAMQQKETEDKLAQLEEAVRAGKVDQATGHLDSLEQQIDAIAKALGSSGGGFESEGFSQGQRARAEALDRLLGLEMEQRELARETETLRREASKAALQAMQGSSEGNLDKLASEVDKVRRNVQRMGRQGVDPDTRERLEQLEQRLDDTATALRERNLGEAQSMSRMARDAADAVSRELRLSSLMFPGHGGSTAKRAEDGERLAKETSSMERAIDRLSPSLEEHMDKKARERLAKNGTPKGEVVDAAGKLADEFASSAEGLPPDEKTAKALREAMESMREGQQAIEARDPIDGSRAQGEAAERLAKLRQDFEQSLGGGGGGQGDGGEGGSRGGEGFQDPRAQVRIPLGEGHRSPLEVRRRILDAMQEQPPAAYEDEVRRYYEGLLR